MDSDQVLRSIYEYGYTAEQIASAMSTDINEFTEEEFRPRTECYVALAPGLHDEGRLHEAFEKLERRAPVSYTHLTWRASSSACGSSTTHRG